MHWWRRHIIISLIRGCMPATIHEERQAQYSIENFAASIAADYCRRPSVSKNGGTNYGEGGLSTAPPWMVRGDRFWGGSLIV